MVFGLFAIAWNVFIWVQIAVDARKARARELRDSAKRDVRELERELRREITDLRRDLRREITEVKYARGR